MVLPVVAVETVESKSRVSGKFFVEIEDRFYGCTGAGLTHIQIDERRNIDSCFDRRVRKELQLPQIIAHGPECRFWHTFGNGDEARDVRTDEREGDEDIFAAAAVLALGGLPRLF